MKQDLFLSAVLLVYVPMSLADLPKAAGPGQRVEPKRVARIGPDFRIIGPWLEYRQGGISQSPCGTELIYDCFEPDPADNSPGCRPEYDLPCSDFINECDGFRWWFGYCYCNMYTADDMLAMKPGSEGTFSQHIELAWHWDPGPVHWEESCLLILYTAEDAAATCVLPALDNFYEGVVYNFGLLPQRSGYWYADIDSLCDVGLGHQMPVDGQGGTLFIQAQAIVDSSIILATCSQPMLWGTKSPLDLNPGEAPYTQGPFHWDDDNHPFGELGADECFLYAGGVECPDPLSTMMCFYGYRPGPCDGILCGDLNCDGAFDGGDIDPFLFCIGNPTDCWSRYPPYCPLQCVADINGDGAVDGADIDVFFEVLMVGHCP